MKNFLNYKWKNVINQDKISLWKISWIIFSVKNEKIMWFIFKKNFISYDYFFVENMISNWKNNIKIKDDKNSKFEYIYEIIWKIVKNEELKIIWTIEDIEFDEYYNLINIIIDEWFSFSSLEIINKKNIKLKKSFKKIQKNNVISYKKDFIIIKDKESINNEKKILENFSKIFINIKSPNYYLNK